MPVPLLLALLVPSAVASTYDEPWQEQVLQRADALVKLRITATEDGKLARFQRLEQLAGVNVPERGAIDRYDALAVTSYFPGADFPLQFSKGDEGYFLLRATDQADRWSIPSPTSGFAMADDSGVVATFRHSYHQAMVPEQLYRDATLAIFQHLHGQAWDEQGMRATMRGLLDQAPMTSAGPQLEQFFQQHVALESCYHFCQSADLARLEPFLASDGFHVQVSAARAISAIDTPEARQRLFQFLQDDSRQGFARVMAVWGLRRLDAREYLAQLQEYLSKAPTEETGFGGNIMDPRVGTAFPDSVRDAVSELIVAWGG